MQTSLMNVPGNNQKKSAGKERDARPKDKNRVDEIAQTSEPGRKGEESIYVPPSTAEGKQSNHEYPDSSSAAHGNYGLEHFLDKGSIANEDGHLAERSEEKESMSKEAAKDHSKSPDWVNLATDNWRSLTQSIKGQADQADQRVKKKPYAYILGALGIGFALAKWLF